MPVSGQQIDDRCGSGLQAVIQAVLQVQSGGCDLVLAGGVESMSQTELQASGMRWNVKADSIALTDRPARARVSGGGQNFPVPGGMLDTAENLRAEYLISRADPDAVAVHSHQRAIPTQKNGVSDREIASVPGPQRTGDHLVIATDEPLRVDAAHAVLSKLRPIRGTIDPQSTVTAGNASGQNDGTALAIVTTAESARTLGLGPLARLACWGVAGVAPRVVGLGPIEATGKALGMLGLGFDDMGVIEPKEVFAAQTRAVTRIWGLGPAEDRLNPNGSGISLGHPVGATGARILATLRHEKDLGEVRYGLETNYIGGGQGLAGVFERATTTMGQGYS